MARPVTLFTGYWDFRSIGHGRVAFESAFERDKQ